MEQDSKTQIQNDILDFIDDYIRETPVEIVQKDILFISQMGFDGISAKEYFDMIGLRRDITIDTNC